MRALAPLLVLSLTLAACGPAETPAEAPSEVSGELAGAHPPGQASPAAAPEDESPAEPIGSPLAAALAASDIAYAERAQRRALDFAPTGQSVAWRNPDTGHSGAYVPRAAYRGAAGQYCRSYQQLVTIGDDARQANGAACKQSGGAWRLVP